VSPPRELEHDFAAALLGGPEDLVVAQIQADGLDPAARLAIYRHHVLATLTEALEATYPVVVRLVDRRFFAYAADQFIRRPPPAGRASSSTERRSPIFWRRSRHRGT